MRGKAQDVAISSRDDLRLVVSLVGRTTSPSREAEQPSEGNSILSCREVDVQTRPLRTGVLYFYVTSGVVSAYSDVTVEAKNLNRLCKKLEPTEF
jgi:hypothetical protein